MADVGLYVPLKIAAPWHPKLLRVTAEASWLWVCGLCYCKQQLSDGFISDEALLALPAKAQHAPVPELAYQLVAAGLWTRAEEGWRVHDYLDHNLSREDVSGLLELRRAAGSKGGHETAARRKQLAAALAAAGAAAAAPASAPASAAPRDRDRDRDKDIRASLRSAKNSHD